MANQFGQQFENMPNSKAVESTPSDLATAKPTGPQPLIELRNIDKFYGQTKVLDDVSISLKPGVTGLLGPNGAGKSTLIKVILGLVRISGGQRKRDGP